jgi:hypothetical protein
MHAKKEGNLEEVEVIEQNEETCPPWTVKPLVGDALSWLRC